MDFLKHESITIGKLTSKINSNTASATQTLNVLNKNAEQTLTNFDQIDEKIKSINIKIMRKLGQFSGQEELEQQIGLES